MTKFERVLTDVEMTVAINDGCTADLFSLAERVEQAVLQSPEIQAWKRDAERLDWLADPNNSIGNVQLPTECVTENLHSLRAAIDAAKERHK